ncbi:MAG: ABC transporter ATP-binding protein [Hyphomicrobiales bacterium]|nr:ABC transporter ATP-binding protein [Hyphomicrobiales bacterium]
MRIEGSRVKGEASPAVELIKVSKSFDAVQAVRELSLTIRQGELLTLLGPSGCGKTTLLNMLAGFEVPSAGSIVIGGRDVTAVPPYRRNTGMVFQNYALFPHMNVFDNVAFGLRMRKMAKFEMARAVGHALEMVKLEGLASRRIRQLSGGQQQRVALARAIVIEPKVLLLDEPLSALDRNLRGAMQVELRELHERTGLTTLFVTHDQEEALGLSDRIVVMSRGEIQQVATPLELYRLPANGFVASFIGEINRLPPARCRTEGNDVVFEIAGGIVLRARKRNQPTIGAGQETHLFVRPEHLTLVEGDRPAPNRVSCRVTAHLYQGAYTLTRVDAGPLGNLQLRVLGGEVIAAAPIGSQIKISIDLDKAVILAG